MKQIIHFYPIKSHKQFIFQERIPDGIENASIEISEREKNDITEKMLANTDKIQRLANATDVWKEQKHIERGGVPRQSFQEKVIILQSYIQSLGLPVDLPYRNGLAIYGPITTKSLIKVQLTIGNFYTGNIDGRFGDLSYKGSLKYIQNQREIGNVREETQPKTRQFNQEVKAESAQTLNIPIETISQNQEFFNQEKKLFFERQSEMLHTIEKTLEVARQSTTNLQVPIYPNAPESGTYYNQLAQQLEQIRKSYSLQILVRNESYSIQEFNNKCTKTRIAITQEMYQNLPGGQGSVFMKRMPSSRKNDIKNVTRALDRKVGEITKNRETKKQYIQSTLLSTINIQRIPSDREIDGIKLVQFITDHNVKTHYDLIWAISEYYNSLSPSTALEVDIFFAISFHESRFDPCAVSKGYCLGVGQGSSFFHGIRSNMKGREINPFNPTESFTRMGSFLHDRTKGTKNMSIEKRGEYVIKEYGNQSQHNYKNKVKTEYATFLELLKEVDPTLVMNGKLVRPTHLR